MIFQWGNNDTGSDGTWHGAAEENMNVSPTIPDMPSTKDGHKNVQGEGSCDVDHIPRQVRVPV